MDTAGIPVYHIDASAIQALLSQATPIALGDIQGSAHKIKEDDVST